ncbi:MAG: helix-turn-helix domain-containing protein [Micropepsaceae bacterium]
MSHQAFSSQTTARSRPGSKQDLLQNSSANTIRIATSDDAASPLLTPKQAAAYLGLSIWTLARMRERGDGPAYVAYSRRYFYEREALDAFIARNRRLGAERR